MNTHKKETYQTARKRKAVKPVESKSVVAPQKKSDIALKKKPTETKQAQQDQKKRSKFDDAFQSVLQSVQKISHEKKFYIIKFFIVIISICSK